MNFLGFLELDTEVKCLVFRAIWKKQQKLCLGICIFTPCALFCAAGRSFWRFVVLKDSGKRDVSSGVVRDFRGGWLLLTSLLTSSLGVLEIPYV